jgi:hypothetical protein
MNIDPINLFSWATGTTPNLWQGFLYAILGLAGAVVTIYFVIGGAIPTSAGAALESEFKELEKKARESAELRKKALEDPSSVTAALIEAFSKDEDRQRDDLERKRKNLFRTWAFVYVFLGVFFSVMLAQDLLQAITIGAGWTSILAAFGLKKENEEVKAETSEQADVLERSLEELETKLGSLKGSQLSDAQVSNLNFEDAIKEAEEAVMKLRLRIQYG